MKAVLFILAYVLVFGSAFIPPRLGGKQVLAFKACEFPRKTHAPIASCHSPLIKRRPLYLDIFGLGPSEIAVIVGAWAVLFGPGRKKETGAKGENVIGGWYKERKDRITEMKKAATERRVRRQLQFINEALEENNDYVLNKMDEYNELYGKDI